MSSLVVRPKELENPSKEKPFDHCKLGRDKFAEPLSTLITNAQAPFVLSINGAYGSGKTTFLRMWERHLENKGHVCVYLNAWETDFAEDPLVPILAELSKLVADEDDEAASKKALATAKTMGLHLLRRGPGVALKLATLGILDADQIGKDAEKEIAKLVESVTADVMADTVKQFEADREDMESFKESLAEFAREISAGPTEEEKFGDRKLIVLVDELDRCRPTYAIELLERIKHLFDVDHMVFVLGIDQDQLRHSVSGVYGGEGFDSEGYLKKFVDLEVRLPNPETKAYVEHLILHLGFDETNSRLRTDSTSLSDLQGFLTFMFEGVRLSLRRQNQVMTRLRLALLAVPAGHNSNPFTLSVLCFLHDWKAALFKKIVDGSVAEEDFEFLRSEFGNWTGAAEASTDSEYRRWWFEVAFESHLISILKELGIAVSFDQEPRSGAEITERTNEIYKLTRRISVGLQNSLERMSFAQQFQLD